MILRNRTSPKGEETEKFEMLSGVEAPNLEGQDVVQE